MLILSGSSHPQLAADLAKELKRPLADRSITRFSDQTFRIKINTDVKGKTVILVQTLIHPVHDHLIELLLLADAAKSSGANKVIAVIPYLAYSKQDQVFLPGESLSVRPIAQILSHTSIDEIITLDLHHPRIADFFSIPIHNLSFLSTLIHETNFSPASTAIIAPDKGAVDRAKFISNQVKLPLVVIDKSRNLLTGEVTIHRLSDLVNNKHCLIVDDLIVTGATLVEAAKFLKSRGAKTVSVFATHGIFTKGFQKLLSAGINSITVSDSVPHQNLQNWIKTISVVPLLTEAVKNLTKNQHPL